MQGPQLPPHLQRQRDEEREPETEKTSTTAASIGPQRPTVGPSVGPQLPPHLQKSSEDDESDTQQAPSIGPSRPPVGPQVGPQRPEPSVASIGPSRPQQGPQRPVVGPTMPPAPLDQKPSYPANTPPADDDSDDDFGPLPPGASKGNGDDDDDSSDDDNFGPSLPGAVDSAREEAEALARLSSHVTASSKTDPNKPTRDAWMLAPPTSSDISTRMDPTKLKNRKFQTGKGARAPHGGGSGSSGPGSLWTETPEQKAARLRDEMLGIKRPAQIGDQEAEGAAGDSAKRRKKLLEDEETERRVAEYTEKFRGKALVKEHQESRKGRKDVEESDDPSKRAFDWDKDIKRGVRIGDAQKRDMLKRAGGMGDRFSKGKFL